MPLPSKELETMSAVYNLLGAQTTDGAGGGGGAGGAQIRVKLLDLLHHGSAVSMRHLTFASSAPIIEGQ
jgi:hypothetical protein